MADIIVFASGNGSNFEALLKQFSQTRHSIACLITNNPDARAITRAQKHNIPFHVVSWVNKTRGEAEARVNSILDTYTFDIIVLAGFMKILSPEFVNRYKHRIVNIHPSLLPKYPGTNSIEKSYKSNDKKLGITIHYVDSGVDTGPILKQYSFNRTGNETLSEIEQKIHTLEHTYYPEVILSILDKSNNDGGNT